MPAPSSCDYAIVRVVPRVERGEFINVGVIVFCRTRRFLAAGIFLDRARLNALAPELDLDILDQQLQYLPRICRGGIMAGPLGGLSQAERFHWLVSPRSTVIQTSAVHCALWENPAAALDHLMRLMVLPPDNMRRYHGG